ncbi:unnamed protein product [Rhizophagus irregularis]|nr:unnamed protein product [Rhizophagus irregularis]
MLMVKLTLDIAKEIARNRSLQKRKEKKGGLCLATEYVNRRDSLELQCKEDPISGRLQQRIFLRELGVKDVVHQRQYCTRTSGKCLSTDYVNTDTPMLWRCGKGHEWSTTLYQIKNMRSWCSQSAGKFPRGLTEAKEIAHSRGGMYLSTEYINLCVPMQWKCNKSHKWFASFNGIRHAKTWCPVDA